MTNLNLLTVTPFAALGGAAVVVMLVSTFVRSHLVVFGVTLAGIAGAIVAVGLVAAAADRRATILFQMDGYALFFMVVILATAGLVVVLSHGYVERSEKDRAEYYVLILLATLGAAALVSSSHFASFFLGLEILSVALYGLIAYPARRAASVEAGLKYLVLAATTAAFLVFGMALVYAVSGTLTLAGLNTFVSGVSGLQKGMFLTGLILILTGVGFKLAVVPFHMWTPDIYQGAPAPVTAFIASVSKSALFALLLRWYLTQVQAPGGHTLFVVLSVVAFASMAVGNLLALLQRNVKRLLAYSSISHLGYLLVALLAGGPLARTAVAFYLVAYSLTMVAAFGVVGALGNARREPESIEDYRGLGRRKPWLAGVFTLALLSLAGIPITAGFIGKFLLVEAGAGASRWALVLVLVLTSALGLFYYLRVIITMFGRAESDAAAEHSTPHSAPSAFQASRTAPLTAAALALIALALLVLGLYPRLLLQVIERVAGTG